MQRAGDRALAGGAWRGLLKLLAPALGLALLGCGPRRDPLEAYAEQELRFFRAGVDIEQEARAVEATFARAGMRVVAERRGPGFHAIGAADQRFTHTAVRVVTARGVSAAADGDRTAVLSPSRVHLLEELPVQVGAVTLVGWLRIAEGDAGGCAEIFRVDPGGYARALEVVVSAFGGDACLGGLALRGGELWGALVWPSLGTDRSPAIALPMALEKRALDDPRPPERLVTRDVDGWTGAERRVREDALSALGSFEERHPRALELAALARLDGADRDTQRAAYTRHAGAPRTRAERTLWQQSVDLIEDGWGRKEPPPEASVPPSAPDAGAVLQSGGDGQEAEEEGGLAR